MEPFFSLLQGRIRGFNKKILSNRILVWFGLISFPLYLWHWLLLSFVRVVESKTPSIGIRVTCVGLAICLAWITYKYIERPFRYGNYNKSKTFILVSLSIIVGLMGLVIFNQEGYEKRESINGFINNKNELIRTPAKNNECIQYLAPIAPLFPYCKFKDNGATETVAVIGDSHAHVAYPGVAEFFKNRNTVLFANSGLPSLVRICNDRKYSRRA
ncbi:acyltransferase family protein [Polynucleobacter necessarius]|uniref:acyltransferase family protein n=1 Tax=Polynucleobacter necessarius TaxID=576610 RepID=UPI0013B06609|nr:acyltransferase family protein [Polynucleobacter necessarius]